MQHDSRYSGNSSRGRELCNTSLGTVVTHARGRELCNTSLGTVVTHHEAVSYATRVSVQW